MAGDVKIGGGHSSFVYANVGDSNDPPKLRKSTAVFDDTDPQPIKVYRCPKGTRKSDLDKMKPIDTLDTATLDQGMFYWIEWD